MLDIYKTYVLNFRLAMTDRAVNNLLDINHNPAKIETESILTLLKFMPDQKSSKYIPRELEEEIRPFLDRKEIIAIVGARQVGKTTLLGHIFKQLKSKGKKIEFITFEKKSDLALFEDVEDFKDYYKDYDVVIIDEFHYAKEGGKELKYLFDTTDIKFIISGSSSLELTFETGRYLVGRMFKFTLYPFSFREFLLAKNKKLFNILESRVPNILSLSSQDFNSEIFGKEVRSRLEEQLEEYLVFGGYPEVVLSKTKKARKKVLESILENYLLKDISALLNLETQTELRKLSEFLSAQIGNLVNYKELSNATGLNYKQVLKHLKTLENTFILQLIKPFYRNPRTELVKTPKVYFVDTGFRNYLLADFKKISSRKDRGSLAENFVFTSLQRGDFDKINFWRTKSKAEVDFVVQKEGLLIPFEAKYSNTLSPGKSFYSFLDKFSPAKAYVLTKNKFGTKKKGQTKIYFAPVYCF